jgi:hypothetical protein
MRFHKKRKGDKKWKKYLDKATKGRLNTLKPGERKEIHLEIGVIDGKQEIEEFKNLFKQ